MFLTKCTTHLWLCVFGNTLSNEPLNPAIPSLDMYNISLTPRSFKSSNTLLQKLPDSVSSIHNPKTSLYPFVSTPIMTYTAFFEVVISSFIGIYMQSAYVNTYIGFNFLVLHFSVSSDTVDINFEISSLFIFTPYNSFSVFSISRRLTPLAYNAIHLSSKPVNFVCPFSITIGLNVAFLSLGVCIFIFPYFVFTVFSLQYPFLRFLLLFSFLCAYF